MLTTAKSGADWKLALLLTAGLRILYSGIAAVFSLVSHPDQALVRSNAFTEHLPSPGTLYYALLGIWGRFDTLWYVHIAQNGYDRPEAVVFYPLYPGLIRILRPIAEGMGGALLISTVSSFFLFWGFVRLLRMESPDRSPFRALALFAVWPASFVFFAGYTEALAIALVVWCILFARDERWASAAACGFAAGLTRSMGILLIVPLAVMAWHSRRLSLVDCSGSARHLRLLGMAACRGTSQRDRRLPVLEHGYRCSVDYSLAGSVVSCAHAGHAGGHQPGGLDLLYGRGDDDAATD